ncbi:MAG: restriction system protein [Acidobacteriota bacterium]|jgi:restriction system protein|nr:restriction system protein [Acidobacteriota bacterium]
MSDKGISLSSSTVVAVSILKEALGRASITLKSLLHFGGKTDEGFVVQAVALPWREIVRRLAQDPKFLYEIDWRAMEELIAGAYKQYGCPDVVLTPRSGDKGRDVIATWPGQGAIRVMDQVKAYSPGHLVTPDEVRSMLGVLSGEGNVSKGVITTSSDFAPSVRNNPQIAQFLPFRLELVNGDELVKWLLGTKKAAEPPARTDG